MKRLFVLVAMLAAAQDDVIKVATRLVQFNVIARDRKGPVADLTKNDFTILDHGKRREIAVFHMDSRKGHAVEELAALPPNVFTNKRPVEANSTILLFDGVNTRYADQSYARLQIIKFIERLQPGDRVAIYALGRELQVIHDFSSDTASLIEAARALRVRIGAADELHSHTGTDAQLSAATTGRFSVVFGEMLDNLAGRSTESGVAARIDKTELALISIARYFGSVPGRKNLVWVSSGFPITLGEKFDTRARFDAKVESASRALMDANVAVYPVDARGLMGSGYGADGVPPPGLTGGPVGYSEQVMMTLLAERTGGRAYFNANDLQGSIRRALDDADVTYTLGFYLPEAEMDSKFHDTKITVARKGVEVRARGGYIAYGDPVKSERSREVAMKQVLAAPLDATGLPVTVRLDRTPKGLNITAMLDPHSLSFSPKDGQYVDGVDFVIAQQGTDGNLLKVESELLSIVFSPERYKQIMQEDLQISRGMELMPGAKTIRVMFYDRNSGLVGSARGPVLR